MKTKQMNNRVRADLRCLAIAEPIWLQAKELAEKESRSVSNFIRQLIREKYENEIKGGVLVMPG